MFIRSLTCVRDDSRDWVIGILPMFMRSLDSATTPLRSARDKGSCVRDDSKDSSLPYFD